MKPATKASAGAATSSAGAPTWSSRPSTRTPTRSASAAASSKSCVTSSVGSASSCEQLPQLGPHARARVARRARRAARRAGAPSGSRASARASATRWRSPPEIVDGRASARCAIPKRSSSSSTRVVPAERDVRPHAHVRKERVLLEHEPDATALRWYVDAARACRATSRPRSTTRPRSGRSSPAIARSTLVFPAPEGPTRATVSRPTSSATASRKARRP